MILPFLELKESTPNPMWNTKLTICAKAILPNISTLYCAAIGSAASPKTPVLPNRATSMR